MFGNKHEKQQDLRIQALEAKVERLEDRIKSLETLNAAKPRATRAKKA